MEHSSRKSSWDFKEALISAPVLAFPDCILPFMMYTDAFALGIGAVLTQEDVRRKHRAVAYASWTLNRVEFIYSVTHQKTLAVVWAPKHFKDIILGYPITVFIDHAALTELSKGRNLTYRLERSILLYRSSIQHSSIYPVWPT